MYHFISFTGQWHRPIHLFHQTMFYNLLVLIPRKSWYSWSLLTRFPRVLKDATAHVTFAVSWFVKQGVVLLMRPMGRRWGRCGQSVSEARGLEAGLSGALCRVTPLNLCTPSLPCTHVTPTFLFLCYSLYPATPSFPCHCIIPNHSFVHPSLPCSPLPLHFFTPSFPCHSLIPVTPTFLVITHSGVHAQAQVIALSLVASLAGGGPDLPLPTPGELLLFIYLLWGCGDVSSITALL